MDDSQGQTSASESFAEPSQQQGGRVARLILEIIETVALAIILFLVISALSSRIRIESISMVPTLQPGDYVIVDKLSFYLRTPRRGEIVVFNLPQDSSQRYIKRLIGLSGEKLTIQGGSVFIDGVPLNEPYIQVPTSREGSWDIPADSFFVMGDNRNNSSDSRVWGTVASEDMIGRAIIVYWPPDQWAVLENRAYAAGGP